MGDIDLVGIQSLDVEPVASGAGADFSDTKGIKAFVPLTAGNIEYISETGVMKLFLGIVGYDYKIRGKVEFTTNTTCDILVYLREED